MAFKQTRQAKSYSHLEWIGFFLVDVALLLAFAIQYKHYYEILVLGFALMLYELDRRYLFFPQYFRLYVILLKAGLIGDLVLGIGLGLWHYNFEHLYEYIFLYGVEYPVAGVVMVQSYIFASKLLKRRKQVRRLLPLAVYKQGIAILGLCSLVSAGLALTPRFYEVFSLVFYASIALTALFLLSYVSRVRGNDNLLEELHSNPLKTLLVLFVVTYFFAFVHEVSNSVAQQWTYSAFSYAHMQLWGIPLIILPFWPLLVLLPVAAYYYVVPSRLAAAKPKKTATARPRRTFIAHLPRHAHHT